MGVAVVITSVLLFMAVVALAVIQLLVWRAHVDLRKDTDSAVSQVYDDMDLAIQALEKKQSEAVTTKVVTANTVKIGSSSISHSAPSGETLHPPVSPKPTPEPNPKPKPKPTQTVEGFAADDQWIHMTDASGQKYHPGGIAAATAWLRDGMTIPGGTCVSEAPGTPGMSGGSVCMGGSADASALNIIGRSPVTAVPSSRVVRVHDALSFSNGTSAIATMPVNYSDKSGPRVLTVSPLGAIADGSYGKPQPSEEGLVYVNGALATRSLMATDSIDGSTSSHVTIGILEGRKQPAMLMGSDSGLWIMGSDTNGNMALESYGRDNAFRMSMGRSGMGVMLAPGEVPGEAVDVQGNIRASGKLCAGSECVTSENLSAVKSLLQQPSPATVARDTANAIVAQQQQQLTALQDQLKQQQQLQQQMQLQLQAASTPAVSK